MIYNKYEKYNWLYMKREDNMKEKFVGIAKVGEKGQIVIPKEARDMFDQTTPNMIQRISEIFERNHLIYGDV